MCVLREIQQSILRVLLTEVRGVQHQNKTFLWLCFYYYYYFETIVRCCNGWDGSLMTAVHVVVLVGLLPVVVLREFLC